MFRSRKIAVARLRAHPAASPIEVPHLRIAARWISLPSFVLVAASVASAQVAPPPTVTNSYALVYEDNFVTDPAGANGALENVYISPGIPARPDWEYRTGLKFNCTLQASSQNVFLSPSAGGVPGLILSDIASNPSSYDAQFPQGDIQEAYQTYTCGGLASTRRFGFGYYETYANIGVYTPTAGFHTSFWRWNQDARGYAANETDVFENESAQNLNNSGGGFTQGIYSWNDVNGAPTPNTFSGSHPFISWDNISGGFSNAHTFGVLVSPTGYNYYVDANATSDGSTYSGVVPFPGPYTPTGIEFSSVGSAYASSYNSANLQGSWIEYDGVNQTKTYNYAFQYFKYYQATDPALLRAQALPPGSIFIDPTVPSGGRSSFTPGKFVAYQPYTNPGSDTNVQFGPQGYLGQHAYADTTAKDTAEWSHTFTSADAGSYDVFLYNAAVGIYQLPGIVNAQNPPQYVPDSAQYTTYQLTGSVGTAAAAQTISQTTAGQQWVPLNSTSSSTTYPTNTYAFTAGSTANIVLTVGSETATTVGGVQYFPHTTADSVSFVPVYTFGTDSSAYSDSGFSSSSLSGWAGDTASRYSSLAGNSTARAQWNAPLPAAGTYSIYAWSPAGNDTTTYAYYTLSDGSTALGSAVVNESTQGNQWVPLGTYTWTGTVANIVVQNGNGSGHPANAYLRTNAIKIVPQIPTDYIVCTSSTGIYNASLYSTSGTWTNGTKGSSLCGGVDQTASGSSASATFYPQVPVAGMYHAYIYSDPSLSSTTQVTVNSHSSQPALCSGITTTGSNGWVYLGDYVFGPDSYPNSSKTLVNDSVVIASTGGTVGVSALKLSYSSSPGVAANVCTNN